MSALDREVCLVSLPALLVSISFATIPANAQSVWTATDEPHSAVNNLRCRGGAGFEFSSLGFKAISSDNVQVAVALTFAPGSKAAGFKSKGLDAGTCSWVDRPLAANEPREVRFITQAYAQLRSGPLDTSVDAAERLPDVQSIATYLRKPGHYWDFRAFNTGKGYFDTTDHHSWMDYSTLKPPRSAGDDGGDSGASSAPWLVRAATGGGISGRYRQVTIDADGNLSASDSQGDVHCSAKLWPMNVHKVEAAIARSRPEQWKEYYGPASRCCDRMTSSLQLDRESSSQHMKVSTSWLDDGDGKLPEGLTALFDSVWSATDMCAFR